MAMTISLDLTQIGQQFEKGITDSVKAIADSVLTELVVRTPIDVGTAKSNWVVGINDYGDGPIPAYAPGTGGSTFQQNVNDAIEAGSREIANATLNDTINITNNLDYIEKLNNGSSTQAPAGFVEDAVVIGITAVKNVKII
jgi:hypothetical protein